MKRFKVKPRFIVGDIVKHKNSDYCLRVDQWISNGHVYVMEAGEGHRVRLNWRYAEREFEILKAAPRPLELPPRRRAIEL